MKEKEDGGREKEIGREPRRKEGGVREGETGEKEKMLTARGGQEGRSKVGGRDSDETEKLSERKRE